MCKASLWRSAAASAAYAIRVTDEAGELVATCQGMAYRRLPDPGPAEPDPPPR
jgi:acyl-coenzyme A thioesterase PaaI-like protein